MGTAKFWSAWKELGDHKVIEAEVAKHITVVLTEEQLHTLYEQRDVWMHEGAEPYAVLRRQVTEQDRALYSLCRPERLLEIMFRYMLFDAGEKEGRALSAVLLRARFSTASARCTRTTRARAAWSGTPRGVVRV